jgi:choline-glycine betaine transporter
LVGAGLEVAYGIQQGPIVWLILAVITTATFSISALVGLDRGIKFCADLNAKLYYILLIFLFHFCLTEK